MRPRSRPRADAGPRSRLPNVRIATAKAIEIDVTGRLRLTSKPESGLNRAPARRRGSPQRDRAAISIALFDRGHCLAGHPSEGGDFLFEVDKLRREFTVLQGVPITRRNPAGDFGAFGTLSSSHCRRAVPAFDRRASLDGRQSGP